LTGDGGVHSAAARSLAVLTFMLLKLVLFAFALLTRMLNSPSTEFPH
jgi:hypothetical protein